jgi:hypothetical protein
MPVNDGLQLCICIPKQLANLPRMRIAGSGFGKFWSSYSTTAAILILLIFWALLYLPALRSYPGWYGDETLAVTAAQNLAPLAVAMTMFLRGRGVIGAFGAFWQP